MTKAPATLLPQYIIDGWLTTRSPLRIGDGDASIKRIDRRKNDGENVQVQTVFVDHQNCAIIPGSSLRGFLRARVESGGDKHLSRSLFGFQDERTGEPAKSLGGALTVCDASIEVKTLPPTTEPFWDQNRATCVASHVVIDRKTRTAAEELLFFEEYVPPGVRFRVQLLIEGGELHGLTCAQLAAALLETLDEVEHSAAHLGASTTSGWGRVAWELDTVRELTSESIAQWLAKPGTPLVEHYGPIVAPLPRPAAKPNIPRPTLHFDIELHLPGPFLVNDDSHAKQKGQHDLAKPDRYALRRGDSPLLPASSFHGALRAQGERIARTIAGASSTLVHDPSSKKGDRPKTVKTKGDLKSLDAVSCLFGAPGWRAPLRVTDFELAPGSAPAQAVRQEFVAIDRFTGGGADERKFNAEPFTGTSGEGFKLRGAILLDITALETLKKNTAPPAISTSAIPKWSDVYRLLTYILRDLEEGDIAFGSGSSKGHGGCSAAVAVIRPPVPIDPELEDAFARFLQRTNTQERRAAQ